ncbi:MAG: hypothetical protein V1816_03025 [Pseudomonadota bacterium]
MARGAGGTEGGLGRFFIGLAMMAGGGYLFFDSIRVVSNFSWGLGLYNVGGFQLTTGLVLIPAIFGIGLIFFNAKNFIGWAAFLGSLLALSFGVIRSIRFQLVQMSAFNLILILVLLFGGIGLFLGSLRTLAKDS